MVTDRKIVTFLDTPQVLSLSFGKAIVYPNIVWNYPRQPIRMEGVYRMKKDMTKVLVEATVRRTLSNIEESPERATRNLIDLGLEFSNGRFQTRLFRQAQKMMQDTKSAYYGLVKHMVSTVDHEILTTFSVNLGYNSCTKGARRIREIEAAEGFNIPWALNLLVNEEKMDAEPDFYLSIFRQGTALGIYTYLLFVTGYPENVLPLAEKQPDCAFILFLRGHLVSRALIEKLRTVKNVMVSVYTDEDMGEACQKLSDAKQLYAVYRQYAEQDRESILSGEWLRSVLPAQPSFAFLQADLSCTPQTQAEVYRYVTAVRDGQQYPLIVMDIKQDTLLIDQVISDGECLVGFDADGSLRTHEGFRREERYNIFRHPLAEILPGVSRK